MKDILHLGSTSVKYHFLRAGDLKTKQNPGINTRKVPFFRARGRNLARGQLKTKRFWNRY